MKQYIYSILQNQNDLSRQQIVANISVAVIIGFLIFISYSASHKGTIYSKKFNVSLIVLTVLTGTVMTVIGNNIALSLGMVGALSIVRFRTAIKDVRDTIYIFWTIIVGICCGIGDFLVAAVGSVAVFLILLIFGCIKSDKRMLLIIRGARSTESTVQALVFRMFSHKAVLRVKNSTEDNIEFIFEISDKVLKNAESNGSGVFESIYNIGNIEYVNIVMQNDEITA